MVPLAIDAFSLKLGVSGDSILGIFAKGKLPLRCISNLTLGVTNEGREAISLTTGAWGLGSELGEGRGGGGGSGGGANTGGGAGGQRRGSTRAARPRRGPARRD